jgi:hypothetical protein
MPRGLKSKPPIPIAVILGIILATALTYAAPGPDDLRTIYAAELTAKTTTLDVPQAVYDELAGLGYQYIDIANAHALSILLASPAKEIVEFKPKDMPWQDLAANLIAYKEQRKIMKTLDAGGGYVTLQVQAQDGGTVTLAAKEDVLVKLRQADPTAVARMKTAGLAEEGILGLLVMAEFHGVAGQELAAEIEQAKDRPQWQSDLAAVLANLDKAVGLA